MSNLGGGLTVCDSCGADLGNGGLNQALVVSDIVDGVAVTWHYCRDRDDGKGGRIEGCARRVIRPEVMVDYGRRNPDSSLTAAPEPATPEPPAPADPAVPEPAEVPSARKRTAKQPAKKPVKRAAKKRARS